VGGVNALAVYCALCRIRSDAAPEDKDSFPAGAARVARHCGLSTRTVKRTLPILAREGLIVILSGVRHDRRGDHEENKITMAGSDSLALGRDYESVPVGTRIKKGSKDPKKEKGNEDEFSEFWKAYPRKASKASALKAWSKAKLPHLPTSSPHWKNRKRTGATRNSFRTPRRGSTVADGRMRSPRPPYRKE